MILVLLGTNPYSFERLARAIDELACRRGWEVFVQLGHTPYEPAHCRWVRFLERDRLLALMKQAEIIVSQGGFGSLRDGLALGRKVVAVPRQPQLGESVDEQADLVRTLENMGRILAVYDICNLEAVIEQAGRFVPKASTKSRIPQIIGDYLHMCGSAPMGEKNVMPEPAISISLVAYNQKQYLERLLPALVEAARLAPIEILVVDHQSRDGTGDYIRDNFPQVQVMRNDKRAGYGENHNRNLQRARGMYFVIMNTDIVTEANAFMRLRAFLENNPDIGMVSPRILNEDGTIQGLNKRYPTVWDLFLRRFIPKRLQQSFQRRLDYYEMRDLGYEGICDVEFLSGSFMFCRTELLRSIGGFDPRYFLYFEDVDMCRRFQKHSRTVYCPEVFVTHLWERAAHKKWIYTYYFVRSAITYFNRWGWRWA